MGSIESNQRQSNKDHSWRVTSVNLNEKVIHINRIKYFIGKGQLGSGAFGRVYPARRSTDGLNVAIKVISLAESSSLGSILYRSVLNEINQSKQLSSQSKHVVQMFDFDFHSSGLAFIVMERGDKDLEKTLSNRSRLTIEEQRILWKQILNILITLQKHSIVHLDLKPSNLVFFGSRLKLVDLGIAQKAKSEGKGPNGTYGFSAPEVRLISSNVYAQYTYKADIWSIGAILYWMNYHQSPEYNYSNQSYRPPSGMSSSKDQSIIHLLRHTLQMNPHERPQTNWLTQHSFTRSSSSSK